jgi:hypothetical protein
LSFDIQITEGNVTVDCETNRFVEKTDFIQIYRRALDLSRAAVDLFAFSTGSGVTVFLEKFTKPDSTITDILPGDPSLHPLSTSIVSGAGDFEMLLGILLTEPTLFRALRDLIEAITLPHVGAMSAARAMEGLRHLLAPKKDRKQGWVIMSKALNISDAYLRVITTQSIGPRHADPTFIPGTITTDVVRKAWTIMNRYFEYRKRGRKSLPLSDFPSLV